MSDYFLSNRAAVDAVAQKAISGLTTQADAFDTKLTFTAQRASALMKYCKEMGDLLGARCQEALGLHRVHIKTLEMRVERIEQIDSIRPEPADESQVPLYLTDQISQLRATVARLQQQVSSLSKHIAAIDRKL